MSQVGGIASEQLVGAFAPEHHLDVAARLLGQQERRQHRGITERLVHVGAEPLDRARQLHVSGMNHVRHGADPPGEPHRRECARRTTDR